LLDPDTGEVFFGASAERLGTVEATLKLGEPGQLTEEAIPGGDHARALDRLIAALRGQGQLMDALAAVGHRVVHGGEAFVQSCIIDERVEAEIERCAVLAPLHNPPNLLGIRVARRALPELRHIAVFDTAFHQTLPETAYRYAVPSAWYEEYGVRRYGFHGTSHRFVAGRAAELLGRPLGELGLLTAHLGNGCSAAAVSGGKSVDTTMGLTPLEGLVMGTRSGDLDPAVIFHMIARAGLSSGEVERVLTRESGLLGLSGKSNDVRTLIETAAGEGSEAARARLALDVFCHRLAKYLGALATTLPRLDALVFTGGIGEHAASVRAATCARLLGLGVALDESKNERGASLIHAAQSRVAVLVIPTNEELMIARDARDLVLLARAT
jgi:acetate kinase